LFTIENLNIGQENDSAWELLKKCIKGIFISIWIGVNFLFQPILCLFWGLIYIPVRLLLLLGMNLPGNKYNLTFSYKGKK
jgi:hypothetical protein